MVIRLLVSSLIAFACGVLGVFVGSRLNRSLPPIAQTRNDMPKSFRDVAEKVSPAVVVIKALLVRADALDEELLPYFDLFRRQPRHPQPALALGSGIIVDKSGLVLTNEHVIEGAAKVVVNLSTAEYVDLPATVVGSDEGSDLAILKIQAGDLPVADWADSDRVAVGDWAIAIGSPFMLSHTLTVGVVSAKGRSPGVLAGVDFGYEMIQTDAAINPGNSGGPLCTTEGKVMGINTAIFTRSGGYMGIGFAIPSNTAREVAVTLRKGGHIVRGWLGVVLEPLDESTAQDLDVESGAVIRDVKAGSPAQRAGLKPGDVVVKAGGESIHDVPHLQRVISRLKPGSRITVIVVNDIDGEEHSREVVIGEFPHAKPLAE